MRGAVTDLRVSYSGSSASSARPKVSVRRPSATAAGAPAETASRCASAYDEWAYQRPCTSDEQQTAALADFRHTYNHHRTHTALGGEPPITRVNSPAGPIHLARGPCWPPGIARLAGPERSGDWEPADVSKSGPGACRAGRQVSSTRLEHVGR
jgi:hypothetical protein